MSSSPTNGASKSKTNLSVASLLSGANGDRLASNEKQNKQQNVCSFNSGNIYRDSSTCTISRNLPTVANSELLYKSISSSRSVSPSQMPPLAPTRPQMVMTQPPVGLVHPIPSSVNYIVQQIYDQHGYVSYPNVNNPTSHVKTIKNAIPVTQLQVSNYQVKTMENVNISPASNITVTQGHSAGLSSASIVYSRLSTSPLSSPTFKDTISPHVSNVEMTISSVDADHCSNYNCEVVSEGNICSSFESEVGLQMSNSKHNALSPTLHTTTHHSFALTASEAKDIQHVAVVPKGWNRTIEKGVIIYISPNKSRIRSYDDMIEYLEADNTCKCGLECPVRPSELFNFDPKVSSKLSFTETEPCCEKEIYCNTCKEFDNLMSSSLKQKRVGRRRRRVCPKNMTEEEEKPVSDRKKILLTGASPLEMFQSGMQAINSLSVSQFKNYRMGLEESTLPKNLSMSNKFNTQAVGSSKSINSTANDNSVSLIQMLSNSLPGASPSLSLSSNNVLQNIIQSSESSPNDSSNESNQITNLISLPNSSTFFELPNTFQPITTNINSIVTSPVPIISSMHPINSISKPIVNCPLSMSTSYKSTVRSYQPIVTSLKSAVNISNTELNHIAADIIKSDSVDMPFPNSLMGNKKCVRKSATKCRPQNKVADVYGDLPCSPIKKFLKKVLPDADVKKASELQLSDYLQHSAYLINQPSIQQPSADVILKTIHPEVVYASRPLLAAAPSSSNKFEIQDISKSLYVSVMSPHSASTNISSTHSSKTDISPSNQSPPPNRTVNSTNQLPEALVNQLGYKFSSSSNNNIDKVIANSNLKTDTIAVSNIPGRVQVHHSAATNIVSPGVKERLLPTNIAITTPTRACSTPCDMNTQLLNRPLQNVNITPTPHLSTSQPPDNGQQMLLLQFVTQNADVSKTTVTKVNTPIVHAYSASHPQAYAHPGQSKLLLMGTGNASQTLATLAMQSNSNTPPLDAVQHTLQIQGLIPVQTNASELSPVPHSVPVQYVTTVNQGISIGNQNSECMYPVMQYLPPTRPAHVSYVYPGTNSPVIRPTKSSATSNYVRIAPAMQVIATTVNNL